MSTFTARYPGICGDCRDEIVPGEEVSYALDDVLVHAGCLPSYVNPDKVPDAGVCTTCGLARALNGTCGCDE